MKKVVIDYETKSEIDILDCGAYKYVQGEEADILICAYRYEDEQTRVWTPGMTLPDWAVNPQNYIIYAHNAEFEWLVTNYIGKKYGFAPTNISNYACLMALCGRYGLPQSLDKAGEILNLKTQKMPEGKFLIKAFCTPPFEQPTGPAWERFIKYCITDVDTAYELMHALPANRLSAIEQRTWELSVAMNAKGIPIDIDAVKQIRLVAECYRESHFELLPELTNGKITKITQTQRLVDFCNAQFEKAGLPYTMENCQANTVAKLLEQDDLPELVETLLDMRAALGLSSIGKYVRFEQQNIGGRIYGNQRYYGAHTGRWTGSGVQLLNLPRASVKDAEADKLLESGAISEREHAKKIEARVENEIARYFSGDIVDSNPVRSARVLIRPMVKASEGHVIMGADYSAIEYVVLEWLAGDTEKINRFAEGSDQYKDQASLMYNVPYDSVTSEQRRTGKIVVLACGYGQGAKQLVVTADKQFGLQITPEESQFMVNGYRRVHNRVVTMWYELKDAMCRAILNPGISVDTGYKGTLFNVVSDKRGAKWLALTLPSGRIMYYNSPSVENGLYGVAPCHMGFHQVTKQWRKMTLTPGRITENIVQALARDILVNGMHAITQNIGDVLIWTVYDEVVCEVPVPRGATDEWKDAKLQEICKYMCDKQPWAEGIPLKAEGFWGPRYKKM